MAGLILFGSIVAYSCYVWLLTVAPTELVSTYAYVNPVIAVLLGAIVLGEQVTAATVAGALLVLAGVALVLFRAFKFPGPKALSPRAARGRRR